MSATRSATPPSVSYSASDELFALPKELIELRDMARTIVNKECIPLESKFLANSPAWGGPPPGGETMVDGTLPEEDWNRLTKASKDSGIWAATLPEEYGGLGYGVLGCVRSRGGEEPQHRPSAVRLRHEPPVLRAARSRRSATCSRSIEGEKRGAFAQTEPHTGSDPGSMKTRAVLEGDEWVINGTKTFISGADRADFHLLLALTDERSARAAASRCSSSTPTRRGSRTRRFATWQSHVAAPVHVFYDDVRVPHEAVLGRGRRRLRARSAVPRDPGPSDARIDGDRLPQPRPRDRDRVGREPRHVRSAARRRQAIQWMLVDVLCHLKSIRAVSYECAARADRGEDVRASAAMAKLMGGNWGHRSIDKIMQILGGAGEIMDGPIPHWYHQIRHGRIGGGTDEIQRILISRAIFKKGKTLWEA